MDGWVDEGIDGRRHGRIDGGRAGRTVGRTDGRVVSQGLQGGSGMKNLSTAQAKMGCPRQLSSPALEICHQKLAVHQWETPTWPGRGGGG